MRLVKIEADLAISEKVIWQLVLDIENYPHYFKYISKVQVQKPVKKGSYWQDTTTILWVPMKINHKVIVLDPGRKIDFEFYLPLGGSVTQQLQIQGSDKMMRIKVQVSIDFKNKILDFFIGPILEKRFEDILATALVRFQKKYGTSRR